MFDLGAAMDPDSASFHGRLGNANTLPNLKAGLGTCAHCGHAISIICIVQVGNGDLYGVGSDCIEKTYASYEPSSLELQRCRKAVTDRKNAMNRKRAQAKRSAKFAEQRAKQAAHLAAREAEMEKMYADRRAKAEARVVANEPFLVAFFGEAWRDYAAQALCEDPHGYNRIESPNGRVLRCKPGQQNFRNGILCEWLNGADAKKSLGDRGITIMCEIRAKHFGRTGSKAFNSKFDELVSMFA